MKILAGLLSAELFAAAAQAESRGTHANSYRHRIDHGDRVVISIDAQKLALGVDRVPSGQLARLQSNADKLK